MTPSSSPLDQVTIVLVEPQDPINIGNTVRASKNMGVRSVRLVRPRKFSRDGVLISAPNAEDVVDTIEVFETLEDALADTIYVVGMTARGRKDKIEVGRPREVAPDLLSRAAVGRVALIFGREDRGLTNAQLDRCDRLITIETSPDYKSLNLGQAVLVMVYELFVASGDATPIRSPKRTFEAATHGDMEGLYGDIERALWAVRFLKPGGGDTVMRSMRRVLQRSELDVRENRILRGVFKEIVGYLERDRQA